ncbi:MAG: ribbon-helix-helix domain-containing protein [Chloroflexota bacterium]|nr:ribbon-helix-helix domain-containing protein [Chloroflexota bacterium]
MPSRYTPFKVRVRTDQLAQLQELAERRGVSITHLVREGVDLFLAENDPQMNISGLGEEEQSDLSGMEDT